MMGSISEARDVFIRIDLFLSFPPFCSVMGGVSGQNGERPLLSVGNLPGGRA